MDPIPVKGMRDPDLDRGSGFLGGQPPARRGPSQRSEGRLHPRAVRVAVVVGIAVLVLGAVQLLVIWFDPCFFGPC